MGFSGEGMVPVLKALGDNLIGVEVGVCKGVNIKNLLDKCHNIRKIYGIDPWIEYPAIDSKTNKSNYITAKQVLSSYMLDDNIKLLKMKSLDAIKLFDDNYFDFVYVDGDHAYEAALSDMQAWWSKVKSGGILSGHDYRPCDIEVRKAVKDFSIEMGLKIHETEFYSWYFNKE